MEILSEIKSKTAWIVDPSHSELSFRVKHLMITNVTGKFQKFEAAVSGPDFTKSPIRVVIDAASVDTNDSNRDGHLLSADFFDVDVFPKITFESTSFRKLNDNAFELTGMLEIKGVGKEVKLDVEYGGTTKDPWGTEKAGFTVSGKINRKDWGLNWNSALETGGVLVSEEVKINADVQLMRQVTQ